MKKSVAAISPVVPGKYFVFVERMVQEHYQTLVVDAASEDEARARALAMFFEGSMAYMSCTQIDPPTARVRPMREKNLRKNEARESERDSEPDFRTSERFSGDSAELLHPTSQFPGTRPAPVTRSQARLLCQNFDASGHSNHSGRGSTLWVILEHCSDADIPYNIRALPGLGYYVERSKAVGDGMALRMSVETVYGAPLE